VTNPEAANLDRWLDAGLACLQAGDLINAQSYFGQALQLDPRNAEAWNLQGLAQRKHGELDRSLVSLRKAVELDPGYYEAWNNLGVAHQQAGDLDAALHSYQAALAIRGDIAEIQLNLANVYRSVADGRAEEHSLNALRLRPSLVEAWLCLGRVYLNSQRPQQAVAALAKAIECPTPNAEAYYFRAMAYETLSLPTNAANDYRQAFALKPNFLAALDGYVHQLQHLCDWHEIDRLSKVLEQAIEDQPVESIASDHSDLISPFSFLCLPSVTHPAQQLRCAQRWAKTIRGQSLEPIPTQSPLAASSGRGVGVEGALDRFFVSSTRPNVPANSPIRLGYLSADFHDHATAALIAELIQAHDRERFRTIGFSYGPDDGSPMRKRLATSFDEFVDLRYLSHREAAAKIRQSSIDILIDLKGYTQFARPEILSYRPAAIQVSYLGYPGTMGADFIDYLIADDFVIPPEQRMHYSERIMALPGCYQVNDRKTEIDAAEQSRHQHGLPDQAFVLCCFNSHYKITPTIFGIWMRVLQKIPRSVLWLLEGSNESRHHLRREANFRGIEASRLVFAPKLPRPQHLRRQTLADLYVDTFPVTAHTAASDTLRVGLPLMTLIGEAMITRVAGSLLHSLGFDEWITASYDGYESRILELASSPSDLMSARRRLSQVVLSHPLFDGQAMARKLETIYHQMIQARGSKL
jgi:protein O-GlcNAc transferase